MKRNLVLCVVFALVFMLFAGCSKGEKVENKPLRLLIDINYFSEEDIARVGQAVAKEAERLGGPADVEVETLPQEGEERDAALRHLRAEIMAGEGPDLFVVESHNSVFDFDKGQIFNESLFPMPQRAMETKAFLPLDEYIVNAQFMEWDALPAVIMGAGHSEKYGQCILPLSYNIDAITYLTKDYIHTPSSEMTWDDVVQSNDKYLQVGAFTALGSHSSAIFGNAADYAEGKLLFTEDDLLQKAKEYSAMIAPLREGMGYTVNGTPFMNNGISIKYDEELGQQLFDSLEGERASKIPVTPVPFYSKEGGVAVTIDLYGAINSATKRPEDAFFILDVILSRDYQASGSLYQADSSAFRLPMYDGLGTESEPVSVGQGTAEWFYTPENYESFRKLRDSITSAHIFNTLDLEIHDTLVLIDNIETGIDWGRWTDRSVEEVVHEHYNRMMQEIVE